MKNKEIFMIDCSNNTSLYNIIKCEVVKETETKLTIHQPGKSYNYTISKDKMYDELTFNEFVDTYRDAEYRVYALLNRKVEDINNEISLLNEQKNYCLNTLHILQLKLHSRYKEVPDGKQK